MIAPKNLMNIKTESLDSNLMNAEGMNVLDAESGGEFANLLQQEVHQGDEHALTLFGDIPSGLENAEPTPKVLDASLIKQINEVVSPEESEQALNLKNPLDLKVQDANKAEKTLKLNDLLAQPKKFDQAEQAAMTNRTQRSPAIIFEKGHVDPQLLQFEDFVAQKNAVTAKSNPGKNGYGTHSKVNVLKEADFGQPVSSEWTIENKMSESALSDLINKESTPLYSMEAPLNTSNQLKTEAASKVFDMNQLTTTDVSDVETVISKVTDYIVQAKAANEPTVNMKLQHQDLGLLDITVSRADQNNVSVVMGAQDSATKLFLTQHKEQMLSHLSNAGVGVSDLRFEQTQTASKDLGQQSQQQNSQQSGGQRQFGSEQNQRNEEQNRRQQLWDVLREKEVA